MFLFWLGNRKNSQSLNSLAGAVSRCMTWSNLEENWINKTESSECSDGNGDSGWFCCLLSLLICCVLSCH